MKREVSIGALASIDNYISTLKEQAGDKQTKFDYFGTFTGYALYRNFKKIHKAVEDFETYRDRKGVELWQKYFQDPERSQEYEKDGKTYRRVRDEFNDQYQSEVNTVNKELEKLADEMVELDFRPIDLDKAVSNLPENVELTHYDFELLSLFQDGQE